MREIIRSVSNTNTQYVAIGWKETDLYNHSLFYFESDNHTEKYPVVGIA